MARHAARAGFGTLALCAAAAALASTPAGAVGTTWVVAPGSVRVTSPCTAATPCQFTYAIATATNGDTIEFKSGEYDYDAHTFNKSLAPADGVTLEQAPGDATRPLIKQSTPFNTCNCQLLALDLNTTMTGLAVDKSITGTNNSASAIDMAPTDTISDSVITGVSGVFVSGAATSGTAEISDTVISATAPGGDGVEVQTTGNGTEGASLDNDTVLATGAGGDALVVQEAFAAHRGTIDGRNTIANGAGDDLVANAAVIGAIATIDMAYSDFRPAAETITGAGTATITGTSHDISGAAAFVSGGYREATGSPTIRAGEADAASGSTDFEGFPRTTAGATDIGASQYALPVLSAGTPSAISSAGATVNGTLNPDGLATTYTVSYGPTSGHGTTTAAVAVPAGTSTNPIAVALPGLAANATYHYAITAANAYGSASTADATFATLAAAPPPLPVISGFTLSRSRFAAARSGASAAAAALRPIGTRISYSDSEAATATFTVSAQLPGVRRGGLCVKPPPHRRRSSHLAHCTRTVTRGSFTHADVAGANGFEFTGRLNGHRLALGRYELSVRAVNSSAETGLPVSAGFRVVARRA
jgi:hypothetical protein